MAQFAHMPLLRVVLAVCFMATFVKSQFDVETFSYESKVKTKTGGSGVGAAYQQGLRISGGGHDCIIFPRDTITTYEGTAKKHDFTCHGDKNTGVYYMQLPVRDAHRYDPAAFKRYLNSAGSGTTKVIITAAVGGLTTTISKVASAAQEYRDIANAGKSYNSMMADYYYDEAVEEAREDRAVKLLKEERRNAARMKEWRHSRIKKYAQY
eukprot:UN01894